jgi:DNA-binding transcriptional regulator GbsR (MarR family)
MIVVIVFFLSAFSFIIAGSFYLKRKQRVQRRINQLIDHNTMITKEVKRTENRSDQKLDSTVSQKYQYD